MKSENDSGVEPLKQACRGRWADIITALTGHDMSLYSVAGSACPVCGGDDRFALMSDFAETGATYCRQCRADGRQSTRDADGIATIMWLSGKPYGEAVDAIRSHLALGQLSLAPVSASPLASPVAPPKASPHPVGRLAIAGDPESPSHKRIAAVWPRAHICTKQVATYLASRKLTLPAVPRPLRFVPKMRYFSAPSTHGGKPTLAGEYPVMVAPIVSPTGELVSVHRTFLAHDCSAKAPVNEPKKIMPPVAKGALRGSAIRLFDLPSTDTTLSLAEGIETALAVRQATGAVVWATGSASAMTSVVLPEQVKTVYVWADRDASLAGQNAATKLADRLVADGRTVYMLLPPKVDIDWLDTLIEKGEEFLRTSLSAATPHVPYSPPPIPTTPPKNEDDDDPFRLARVVLATHLRTDRESGESLPTLRFYRGNWWRWENGYWAELADAEFAAIVSLGVKSEYDRIAHITTDPPRKVTRTIVANVRSAMEATALLPSSTPMPSWLGGSSDWPTSEVIATPTQIVRLSSRQGELLESMPATPRLLNSGCIGTDWDADAPEPKQWIEFLVQLWGDDPDSILTLQEIFGYCLVANTSLQKIFLIIGPPRSGKGTIARILTAMLGESNHCGPTLAGLASNFGLSSLLGKSVAIIGDARLSSRTDLATVTERLLSISGEDHITIDRKFLPSVTTRLPARFLIMSNELPRLTDASGALAHRFILLQMRKSWLGSEDTSLAARLLAELPGILKWSVKGWRRLMARGHFAQPTSASDSLESLHELASPISGFIADECIVDPLSMSKPTDLFAAWQHWCNRAGRDHPGNLQSFCRDLRSAVPSISVRRSRTIAAQRERFYAGIALKTP